MRWRLLWRSVQPLPAGTKLNIEPPNETDKPGSRRHMRPEMERGIEGGPASGGSWVGDCGEIEIGEKIGGGEDTVGGGEGDVGLGG